MPDALYRTAFQLFDTNGNGTVSFRKLTSVFLNINLKEKNYIAYTFIFLGN
jgi:Ca2+-binding EF-hand superfamily protein